MTDDQWLMRIEGGLSAHFREPDGASRAGTEWAVGLKRGDEVHTVRVRALLTDDASRATRRDTKYQAETAMQYLDDRLRGGWHPAAGGEHLIHVGNPLGAAADRRPWWRVW